MSALSAVALLHSRFALFTSFFLFLDRKGSVSLGAVAKQNDPPVPIPPAPYATLLKQVDVS